ncbi:MAG: hypothetical protein ABI663_07955 [Chryseolinea sp.]
MIEKLKLFYQNEKFPFIVIIALGLIAWLNPSTFLWRDDWLYLSFYYEGNYDLFNGHLASEIKPLFQYVLFAEFYVAGLHFAFYQIVNVALLILSAFCFFSIAMSFNINRNVALFCSLLLLLHPVNFVNAFWIFQQCELFHIFFLLSSILYFKKYLDDSKTINLILFGFFLLIQNYFFPNGIFFPILFLFAYFLMKPKGVADKKFIFVVILIFALHLSHALYVQTKMVSGEGILLNIFDKLNYFVKLLATSLYRIAIPNFSPRASIVFNFLPLVALIILMIVTFKGIDDGPKRNAILLGALGLIFSSIVLVLTRYNQSEIHYYYSTLHFPFYFLIIAVLIDHYVVFKKSYLMIGAVLILMGFLLLDFRGKNIFAFRNESNKQQMELGLPYNQYVPFDDPCFLIDGYFGVNDYSESESAIILYRSLLPGNKIKGNKD